jgi:hypothetical protein
MMDFVQIMDTVWEVVVLLPNWRKITLKERKGYAYGINSLSWWMKFIYCLSGVVQILRNKKKKKF